MKKLLIALRRSFLLVLLMSLLLGFVYPLTVMAVGQILFHHKANGSLIERNGKVIGSALLGQDFHSRKYFWSRLSATSPAYNAAASTGSNLSPNNPKLLQAANTRIAALQKADPANKDPIPVDLVAASASGLDPHISLEAAQYQLPRVAGARNMRIEDVQAIMREYTHVPGFGLLGEGYVNVLELNLALDENAAKGH